MVRKREIQLLKEKKISLITNDIINPPRKIFKNFCFLKKKRKRKKFLLKKERKIIRKNGTEKSSGIKGTTGCEEVRPGWMDIDLPLLPPIFSGSGREKRL